MDFLEHLKENSIQFVYVCVALSGGIARYLNNYTMGTPFNFTMFMASTVVSGFSGYMFSLLGIALNLPPTFLFIMAGSGGFFGDQTMKVIAEYINERKVK